MDNFIVTATTGVYIKYIWPTPKFQVRTILIKDVLPRDTKEKVRADMTHFCAADRPLNDTEVMAVINNSFMMYMNTIALTDEPEAMELALCLGVLNFQQVDFLKIQVNAIKETVSYRQITRSKIVALTQKAYETSASFKVCCLTRQ